MKEFKLIFFKELKRVFSDRKLLVSLFVVPTMILFIMYSAIGIFAVTRVVNSSTGESRIGVSGAVPAFIEQALKESDCELVPVGEGDFESMIKGGELELAVIFPADFEQKAQSFAAPEIKAVFDTDSDQSKLALDRLSEAVSRYHTDLVEKSAGVFPAPTVARLSVTSEEAATGRTIGTVAIMLLVVFLFSSCMQQGVDCIAGEKERGFFSSLLMTPAPRLSISAGKTVSLAVVAVLSALSIFIGIVGAVMVIAFYVSSKMPGVGDAAQGIASAAPLGILNFTTLLMTLLCLIFMAVFFASLVCFISSMAKSVKQANSLVSSVYIVLLLLCYMPMITGNTNPAAWSFWMPLYGLISCFINLFGGALTVTQALIACLSTVIGTCVLIWLTSKVFEKEKYLA